MITITERKLQTYLYSLIIITPNTKCECGFRNIFCQNLLRSFWSNCQPPHYPASFFRGPFFLGPICRVPICPKAHLSRGTFVPGPICPGPICPGPICSGAHLSKNRYEQAKCVLNMFPIEVLHCLNP